MSCSIVWCKAAWQMFKLLEGLPAPIVHACWISCMTVQSKLGVCFITESFLRPCCLEQRFRPLHPWDGYQYDRLILAWGRHYADCSRV